MGVYEAICDRFTKDGVTFIRGDSQIVVSNTIDPQSSFTVIVRNDAVSVWWDVGCCLCSIDPTDPAAFEEFLDKAVTNSKATWHADVRSG